MKKLPFLISFLTLSVVCSASMVFLLFDETPPVGLKSIMWGAYINPADNALWINKGSVYGWNRIPRYSEIQPVLVSGTNIKTVNSQSLLGSGNISISPDSAVYRTVSNSFTKAQTNTYLSAKANVISPIFTTDITTPISNIANTQIGNMNTVGAAQRGYIGYSVTGGSGVYPFSANGNMVFQSRGNANQDITFMTGGVVRGYIYGNTGNWNLGYTTGADQGFKLGVNGTFNSVGVASSGVDATTSTHLVRFGQYTTALGLKANASSVVDLTTAQTVAGQKQFTDIFSSGNVNVQAQINANPSTDARGGFAATANSPSSTGALFWGRTSAGNTVFTVSPTGVTSAAQYKLTALNTAPASATATGSTGEIRVTSDFIYVCINTNTWVRSPLATW